jgi:Fe-S cluster assembly scaffold protein SufB
MTPERPIGASIDYRSKPYELNELYKRYGVEFDLDRYAKLLSEEQQLVDHSALASKIATKLKTKFDAVILNNELVFDDSGSLKGADANGALEHMNGLIHDNNRFSAFAGAFAKKAFILDVPSGAEVALSVLFISGTTVAPLLLSVKAGSNSKLTMNEVFASGQGEVMTSMLQNIQGDERSAVEMNVLHVEESGAAGFSIANATAQDRASIAMNSLYAGGAIHKQHSELAAIGSNSRVESNDVVIGVGAQKLDMYTGLLNGGEASVATSEAKVVAMDTSSVIAKGMAKVLHGSKKSLSYLKERGLIYDNGAQIKMMPDMSIDEGEVKATHSSSVSPISEDDIFYISARGVQRDEAKKIVVGGFMLETLGKINDQRIRSIAAAIALSRLRERSGGVPEISLKDAWASQTQGQQAQFDGAHKLR